MIDEYTLLRAEICKQKKLTGINFKKAAELTGLKYQSVRHFMSGFQKDEQTARELARLYGIDFQK